MNEFLKISTLFRNEYLLSLLCLPFTLFNYNKITVSIFSSPSRTYYLIITTSEMWTRQSKGLQTSNFSDVTVLQRVYFILSSNLCISFREFSRGTVKNFLIPVLIVLINKHLYYLLYLRSLILRWFFIVFSY